MSNGGPRTGIHQEQGEAVPEDHEQPPGMNFSVPNVARMFDYYLGGKDNHAADREAARLVLGNAPDIPLAALENREFVKRAVSFLAEEAGITQFVDIGPGLPTQANVHQLARRHAPDARVAYIDNDPVVLAHGRWLLNHVPGVTIIDGDLREPERILSNPALQALIDFTEPVALCMSLVLHFIPARNDAHAIVARLRDELCPGSYIVLTHVTGDERDADTLAGITDVYSDATVPLTVRSRAEVTRFFAGFDLVEPGVVFLSQWRPTTEYYARGGTRWAYAGVGRKAEPE
jgi:S-adenosyl methyltransferase